MLNDTLKINESDIEMLETFMANASAIRDVMNDTDTDARTCAKKVKALFMTQEVGEIAMMMFIIKLKLMVYDE